MIRIKCPNCGSDNLGQAAFCCECGSSLANAKIICPNCGEENDKRAKFCMACGTKLSEDRPKGAGKSVLEDQAVPVKEVAEGSISESGVRAKDASAEKAPKFQETSLENDVKSQNDPSEKAPEFQEPLLESDVKDQIFSYENEPGFQDYLFVSNTDNQKDSPDSLVTAEEADQGKADEKALTAEAEKEDRTSDSHMDTTVHSGTAEDNKENASKEKTGKKGKKIYVLLGLAAAALIAIFFMLNSSPKMESLQVTYSGDTEAGTVLDKSNAGIKVVGLDKNGEKYELTDWTIEDPQTLEMDGSATVTIAYKDLSKKLTVDCSTSELVGISAVYYGDATEGVVLDSDNDGFEVIASYKNGEEEYVTDWTIETPQTLAADSTATVVIDYEGKQCSLDVICTTISIEKIKATYSGSTKAGVEIGEGSSDVTVTAVYKNGETQDVTGWTVDEPVTLEEGKTSKLKIHYGDHDCTLKVECTDLSEKQFKAKCKTYSYDEIARDPDDYKGKKAKFSGTVLQVMEEEGTSEVHLRIAIDDDYDHVIYVAYLMPEGASRILEDDTVTAYGELAGLYSYTSTMNAQITIPLMYALFVE